MLQWEPNPGDAHIKETDKCFEESVMEGESWGKK